MKAPLPTPRFLVAAAALVVGILVTITDGAPAAAGSPPGSGAAAAQPEWAELFGDASLAVIWQSAAAVGEKITAGLAERKLAGIADWAETIHLAAHALVDQVKLEDSERTKRLHGALNQTAKIADDVLNHASHAAPDETAAAHQRLKSALALAKLRLPKAIVEAPAQTPRFVKSDPPAPDPTRKAGTTK
jgi:hypothetical protein